MACSIWTTPHHEHSSSTHASWGSQSICDTMCVAAIKSIKCLHKLTYSTGSIMASSWLLYVYLGIKCHVTWICSSHQIGQWYVSWHQLEPTSFMLWVIHLQGQRSRRSLPPQPGWNILWYHRRWLLFWRPILHRLFCFPSGSYVNSHILWSSIVCISVSIAYFHLLPHVPFSASSAVKVLDVAIKIRELLYYPCRRQNDLLPLWGSQSPHSELASIAQPHLLVPCVVNKRVLQSFYKEKQFLLASQRAHRLVQPVDFSRFSMCSAIPPHGSWPYFAFLSTCWTYKEPSLMAFVHSHKQTVSCRSWFILFLYLENEANVHAGEGVYTSEVYFPFSALYSVYFSSRSLLVADLCMIPEAYVFAYFRVAYG